MFRSSDENGRFIFGYWGNSYYHRKSSVEKKKKEMIDLLFGILCIILSISTVIYYTYVTANPQIKYFEGSYDGLNHYRTYGETEYSFKDNEGITEFILDSHSKKKIYPDDFEEGVKYRIFYEDRTSIIVKVEKLGP